MDLEKVLNVEMLSVNRGIIKKRKNILQLLKEPYFEYGKNKVKIDEKCVKKIAENITLPLESIFLPVSFFIPAGLDEGYIQDERDVRILEIFEIMAVQRGDRCWVKKYEIRGLVAKYPGCFQSIIVK